MKRYCIFILMTLVFCSPAMSGQIQWSDNSMWYGNTMMPDTNKIDVFYLVSCNVVTAKDALGNVSLDSTGSPAMRSLLTSEDKRYIDMELQYVKDSVFGNEFNFIAPYYHQYTFESCTTNPVGFDSIRVEVGKEVCEAFDYYMKNINHGRKYILAGFSEGGEMVLDILRHLNSLSSSSSSSSSSGSKDWYSRMVAAYVIGYKVTAEDTLNYATIRPAKGETDTGVTVSFNSVLKTKGTVAELSRSIWDFVAGGTATCINPVNWKTDSTPAEFTFHGKCKVHIDKKYNVLVVDTDPAYYHKWMRNTPPYSTYGISENCLHHWDIQLYAHHLHDNAIKRMTND